MNVLNKVGDAYSAGAAEAFKKAAEDYGITICGDANYKYEADKEPEMKAIFQKIVKENCCYVNVVFDQPKVIASLLYAARKGGYDGEWFINSEIRDVVTPLQEKMDGSSSVHEVLRGVYGHSHFESILSVFLSNIFATAPTTIETPL